MPPSSLDSRSPLIFNATKLIKPYDEYSRSTFYHFLLGGVTEVAERVIFPVTTRRSCVTVCGHSDYEAMTYHRESLIIA